LLSDLAFFHLGLLLHLYLLFDFLFHFRQVPRLFFFICSARNDTQ
jgi:hypothetical protein